MNITNKTIVITGGGSGIGFETARLLSEKGNKVIITGRNEARLQQAVKQLNNVSYIVSDVTKAADVEHLVRELEKQPVDVLINNAGNAVMYDVVNGDDLYAHAEAEMVTNYLSVIRLTRALLPLLRKQPEAAVVNVTSIVAFAPAAVLTGYSASKAALHAYSLSLRHLLAPTGVKVFELMPPLVDTEFSKEIGGANGIPPAAVAEALWDGFTKDTYEIHVGGTADFYQAFLASPTAAFNILNPA